MRRGSSVSCKLKMQYRFRTRAISAGGRRTRARPARPLCRRPGRERARLPPGFRTARWPLTVHSCLSGTQPVSVEHACRCLSRQLLLRCTAAGCRDGRPVPHPFIHSFDIHLIHLIHLPTPYSFLSVECKRKSRRNR